MRTYMKLLLLAAMFVAFHRIPCMAQDCRVWIKYENNPVLETDGINEYRGIYYHSVIYNDGEFWLYYTSYIPGTEKNATCLATSADGISWDKYGIVLPVVSDPSHTLPEVVMDDNGFKMWYFRGHYLCLATSTYGINWERYSGNPIGGDYQFVDSSVLYDEGIYKMWHRVSTGTTPGIEAIHYSTSNDGINWDYPGLKVLEPGNPGEYDSRRVYAPDVVKINGQYEMWYSAQSDHERIVQRIGHATSPDGINWTKDGGCNPVLTPGAQGDFDSRGITEASVVRVENELFMFYAADDGDFIITSKIGLATAAIKVPPIAHCEPGLDLYGNLILDGSQSYDIDGTVVSWEWELTNRDPSGNDFTLAGEIVSVEGIDTGVYDVTLSVTDDEGLEGIDTVVFCVPRCVARPEATVEMVIHEGKIGLKDGKMEIKGYIYLSDSYPVVHPQARILYELQTGGTTEEPEFDIVGEDQFQFTTDGDKLLFKR